MKRGKFGPLTVTCRLTIIVLMVLCLAPAVFTAPGDTVASIPAPFRCSQGVAFDGEHLWIADRSSDQIYRIDAADSLVSDSLEAPGYIPRGLAWDGTWLWCADAGEQQIYAIDPASRIVERTIPCPVSNPTGLAWDGQHLWLGADGDRELHKISDEDGTTIVSIPAPTSHTWGLAFDGTHLWVSDRYKNMIYMVSPNDGTVINCFDAPGPHSCGLAWAGDLLWNVDYQTDRVYGLAFDDTTRYARTDERAEQMDFVHQTRNFGPDTLLTLDVYLAVPKNRSNQELLAPVAFDPEPADMLTDRWGQQVAHFRFENVGPDEFATVRMKASAKLYKTRYFVFPDRLGSLDDIPSDISTRYLADDTKFSLNDPVIQNAVKEAVGRETNPYWIGRRIFSHVIAKMHYELAGGWNVAPVVLARGSGSCSEYSFVYIAMCRAAGLPARYTGAITVRGDDASYDDVYHRWVEIYLPGYGWLPVDPSGGDSPWPSDQANAFSFINNRFLVTTIGGGGSEYLGWSYNANERWTSRGRCRVEVENFGEWSPAESSSE